MRENDLEQPCRADATAIARQQVFGYRQDLRSTLLQRQGGRPNRCQVKQVPLALHRERTLAVPGDGGLELEDRLEHGQPPDEEGRPGGARNYVMSTQRR